MLQVAPSGYRRHVARQLCPGLRCARAQRDAVLVPHIQRIWHANWQVYGADKVWRQMNREGVTVARCTIERLMRQLGLRGVRRGKVVRTTVPDKAIPFVGWRVSSSMQTDFVLDALEQALYERQPGGDDALIHHSDRGSQYLSIRYTERLAEAGVEPSVGSKGDSYDNALAETINGLYKAELIHRRAPWKTKESVELATLNWVHWFNHHRLLEPVGYIPPAEAEANYWQQLAGQTQAEALT